MLLVGIPVTPASNTHPPTVCLSAPHVLAGVWLGYLLDVFVCAEAREEMERAGGRG